jgi:hypothetical protein
MARVSKQWQRLPHHSPLSHLLLQEGYTGKDIKVQLNIYGANLEKFLTCPGELLTIPKLMIVNDMLPDTPLQEIVNIVFDNWLRGAERGNEIEMRAHKAYIEDFLKHREAGGKEWFVQ